MNRARWTVTVIVIGCVALGLTNLAVAKKGDSGKDLYKEYCKSCHGPDSEHGEYMPLTLIQDQWKRFFDDDFIETHQDVTDPNHDNKPVTEAISEEDLEKIRKFAIDGAADSENPMTCG